MISLEKEFTKEEAEKFQPLMHYFTNLTKELAAFHVDDMVSIANPEHKLLMQLFSTWIKERTIEGRPKDIQDLMNGLEKEYAFTTQEKIKFEPLYSYFTNITAAELCSFDADDLLGAVDNRHVLLMQVFSQLIRIRSEQRRRFEKF
jgi:hypothetical protein